MNNRQLMTAFTVTTIIISLPFTVIHLIANPDDAPISGMQHIVAAMANFFGPWGVVIVRLVDFPNAGLRSFSLVLAVGLTLLGVLIIVSTWLCGKKWIHFLLLACWALFSAVWFAVGLLQIADGLL